MDPLPVAMAERAAVVAETLEGIALSTAQIAEIGILLNQLVSYLQVQYARCATQTTE